MTKVWINCINRNNFILESWVASSLNKIRIDKEKAIIKVEEKDISDVYEIKEQIGQGGYGKVYKAIHRESGATRAIKKVMKKNLD